MRRFRFTLIAICLVLLLLGGRDLYLWIKNPTPQPVDIKLIETAGAPKEWLSVTGGYQDLDRAISTSGTIEMEALLVPLLGEPDQEEIKLLIETRDPQLLALFHEYYFFTDTVPEKKAFREKHANAFSSQRAVTGMLVSGLIAKGNRQKLLKLAKETGLKVTDDVIFLSEGKEPARWRGVFFVAVAISGLARVFWLFLKKKTPSNNL